MLQEQLSHIYFPHCHGNAVDSDLDTRSKNLCLVHILCSKFSGAFRHYSEIVSERFPACIPPYSPSNCRLSINACFCPAVIPILTFLIGILFDGVLAGLHVLVATKCEGGISTSCGFGRLLGTRRGQVEVLCGDSFRISCILNFEIIQE
jgi:hypothetical protein